MVVDSSGDIVSEGAGGGTDTIESSITFSISAASKSYFENITLTGGANINATGNGAANTLIGNSGVNSLWGGYGNDTLTGGAGNDTMHGEMGADIYRFDSSFGQDVIEDNGQNGATEVDRIEFTAYNASDLTFSLANGGLDLVIGVIGESDTITVRNHFASAMQDWVEEIRFADDTIWNRAQIAAAAGLPPIVFDLDGDGIELVSRTESKVRFDADGDGQRQRMGWIGRDDGILALDRNGDGRITNGQEISFIGDMPNANSDLEGLRAFDSNGNGRLDIADNAFGKFRIWRDINQDGISQRNELRSLSALGIRSIDLSPALTFGRTSSEDNSIVAITQFTRRNGSKGVAADVVLAFDASIPASITPNQAVGSPASALDPETNVSAVRRLLGSFLSRAAEAAALKERDRPIDEHVEILADDEFSAVGPSRFAATEDHSPESAPPASVDESQAGTTMYGAPLLAVESASAAPRQLVGLIRQARQATVSPAGWRSESWAQILPDDVPSDPPARPDLLAMAGPAEGDGATDRQVLQMIDAMASFNVSPATLMAKSDLSSSSIGKIMLAADLHAA